jgi:uncharacterized protein YegP (UPF0339 family)
MGKFEISTRADGDFMFNLKASNGEVIMTSQGYSAKSACQNGIASAKKHSKDRKMFKHETATNGKFYFNLTAANYQIIGTSQMYSSKQGRDNGIESVYENAATAEVKDLTIV